MQISVTFRHMNPSEPLKQHALEKAEKLSKFLADGPETHVVLSVEKHQHTADVHIQTQGITVKAVETSGDMYNSIDRVIEKIERQLKRYRHRLQSHRPREGARMKLKFNLLEAAESLESETASDLSPRIIETKDFDARPMMIDEALMQMDLLHNDILVFLNAKTDHINVLYRKKGNQFGLIETAH